MSMKKVTIYTDGASRGNPGPGGYGAVLLYKNKDGTEIRKEIKKAFSSTTNNRMELLGAIVALKELKMSCEVSLYSDSKYLVNAFNENWIESWQKSDFRKGKRDEVKNVDLWQELIELTNKHKVNFNWVKGHNDNKENERCDRLANEAMDELMK